MSDCRNDVDGLLKNRKAAMNPRVSLEMSSAHMAETVAFKLRGDVDVADYAVRIEMDCFDDGIFVLLLMVGPELSTQKGVYSRPVVGSIRGNNDGVLAID
uniref:Uncharacterized protein n=1 Tax=Romanomermis culicivorax TaxID=13658 RepID=A0A915KUZ1_ROMCU